MSDTIVHPSHYSRWDMEPIEFIAINNLPWWLANVIKYTMRHDAKDGLNDLYKARSYLDMKIRNLRGEPSFWQKPVAEERSLARKAPDLKSMMFVSEPTLSFCACGVNVTSKGFECWDDDCLHKQKTGGSIHTKLQEEWSTP